MHLSLTHERHKSWLSHCPIVINAISSYSLTAYTFLYILIPVTLLQSLCIYTGLNQTTDNRFRVFAPSHSIVHPYISIYTCIFFNCVYQRQEKFSHELIIFLSKEPPNAYFTEHTEFICLTTLLSHCISVLPWFTVLSYVVNTQTRCNCGKSWDKNSKQSEV